MYIYRVMLYSVEFAHILSFRNASCGSAENMMMIMMITMMSSSRERGYLRTVTFGSVYKTPHFLPYSIISVQCHTINSLFRLPDSMLKELYRNLTECHFHW